MDKLEELLKNRAEIDLQLEKMRTPITILFSDIRGSTAFFEAEGDVQGLAMVDIHNRLLFPVVERNNGRVVKTIGDAIMASFEKPETALRAAIGMQQALAAHNQGRGPNQQIHIRIGVHSGLGLVKNGDVYGDVVNTASRVETHSEPDHVFVSSELVGTAASIGVNAVSAGSAELKGKAETVELYKLDWSSYAEKVPVPVTAHHRNRTHSWILAGAMVVVFVAVGAVYMRPAAPAEIQGRAPNSSSGIRGASPDLPSSNFDLTGAELSDLLIQSPVAKSILEKSGKPVTREALLNGTLRGLQSESAQKPVTRAELAFVLEDLLTLATGNNDLATKYIGSESSPFSDVETTHPAFNAIMTVTSRNLLPARAGNRFAPIEPVTANEVQSGLKQIEASVQ